MTMLAIAPSRMEEAELVARAVRRDPDAVRAITTAHNRRLYRVARSILRDDSEAEDALQSAYLKAFAALPDFRHDSSLGTWLTRIVINEALGRRRSPPPRTLPIAADGSIEAERPRAGERLEEVDPERAVAQQQIRRLIERAIDELPDGMRTILVARTIEGLSVEETAELFHMRPETVKTRLHRARHKLREELEKTIGPVVIGAFPFDGWRCERMTRAVLERLDLPPR
jgi:RNA polymerase sigma-70 factor (ECF subfamily)